MNDFVPIGTVVKLHENSNIKFMIVGYYPTNQDGESRDYAAIRYPMGVYDSRMYFFFNKEDISDVLHMGYIDDSYTSMIALLKNALEKQKNKSEGGENNA